ncbi:MAG: helix-hairpin-helix domain-containing protein [Thermoplasmatota archaeon]
MGNKKDDSIKGFIKEVMEISSVGELTARILIKNGFDSISKLENTEIEDLIKIDEIGKDKAQKILEGIKEEQKESKELTAEIFCVTCRSIVDIDKEECVECGAEFNVQGPVILPEIGVVDEPKKLLSKFEKDLMDGKETPETWYGRGAILDSMNYKWEALNSYNKVIELDPLYDHIWNAKARAALEVGQVRDAARAYKVAFDTHVANSRIKGLSNEESPMEQEKKKIKKRDVSVKEVENKLFIARSVIHELKRKGVDLTELNNLLDKAVEARNNDKRKKSVETVEKIMHHAEQLREFIDVRVNINEILDELAEYDVEIEEFKSRKKSLIEEINEGKYESTIDELYGLLDTLENKLEKEKARQEDEKEKEEKLTEKLQEIRGMMKELRETSLNIEEFKNGLSEAVNHKKESEYVEGLEKAEDLIEIGNTILDTDEKIIELKDKVKESEFNLKEFGFKEDIEKILELAKDGLYHESYEETLELLKSFDERLTELETERELKDKFSKNVDELKEKFSELKDTSLNVEMIKSMISDAKELKEKEEYEEGINVLKEAIQNADKLLDFSDELEEAKSVLKNVNDLNIDYETYKERLKRIKNEAESGEFENIFEEIEELTEEMENTIEETIAERKQELEYQIDELSQIIEDGKEKEVSMENIEKKLNRAEELKDEEGYYKGLKVLKGLVEKAEMKIQLDPMLFSIDEIIEEIKEEVEVSDFEESKSKIKNKFEEANYEESLRMANDLYEKVLERKDELERREELKEEYEEKSSLAKEKLSACRDTKISVDDIKKMINEAVEAKKKDHYEEALDKLSEAIETGDRVLRIFEMIKEGADKINKLKKYDLDYREYMEHLKDCKKMADIGIYDKAEMILEDALDDIDEELIELGEETLEDVAEDSRDELEAMEEELSRSYEKLRQDVEDLKDLYEVADDFEIQVGIGRKLLKLTIKKIREGDYKKAIKHLEEGEDKILESIEKRIDDMLHHVETLLEDIEEEEKVETAGKIIEEVEDSHENRDYREALKKLVEVRDMLKDIKEFDIDEKISSLEELVEVAEESGLDVEESQEIIEDLRNIEEEKREDIEEELSSKEEKIKSMINVGIKNKIENSREELNNMGLEESKISKPVNLLTEASLAQEEGNLKKALSLILDYHEMLEEGLEDSED